MYSDIQKQVVKFRKRKGENVFTINFVCFYATQLNQPSQNQIILFSLN